MPPDDATQGSTSPRPPVARLLERMRQGDREATAEFMQRYAPLLRRRIRWKLGAGTRRIFDSEEILATLGRRLDQQIHRGAIEVRSEGEFWALVRTMIERTIIDKARVTSRMRAAELEASRHRDSFPADDESNRLVGDEIDQAIEMVGDDDDRRLLELWMRGVSHAESAASLNLSHAAVRKRWQRLMARLRRTMRSREDAR